MSGIFGAVNRETAFQLMRDAHDREMCEVQTSSGLLTNAQYKAAQYGLAELLSSKNHETLYKNYWQAFSRNISTEVPTRSVPLFDESIGARAYFQYLIQCLEMDLNACPQLWGLPKHRWIGVKDAMSMDVSALHGRVLLHTESVLVLHPADKCYALALDVSHIQPIEPLLRDLLINVEVEPPNAVQVKVA